MLGVVSSHACLVTRYKGREGVGAPGEVEDGDGDASNAGDQQADDDKTLRGDLHRTAVEHAGRDAQPHDGVDRVCDIERWGSQACSGCVESRGGRQHSRVEGGEELL